MFQESLLDFAAEVTLFFKSVSGLRYEVEVLPVREGGVNDTTWQLPGAMKWSNLVFKQGFTQGSSLARSTARTGCRSIPAKMVRTNGTITQLDTALNPWQGRGPSSVASTRKWEVS